MTPLIQKLRSAGEAERTLAPASGLFDGAADEIERLIDRTDGLSADLFDAVQTAFNRGAVGWAYLNYPKWVDTLEANAKAARERLNNDPT